MWCKVILIWKNSLQFVVSLYCCFKVTIKNSELAHFAIEEESCPPHSVVLTKWKAEAWLKIGEERETPGPLCIRPLPCPKKLFSRGQNSLFFVLQVQCMGVLVDWCISLCPLPQLGFWHGTFATGSARSQAKKVLAESTPGMASLAPQKGSLSWH